MIPPGKLGEKYVKMVSGDPTMTVDRWADEMMKRAEKRQMELCHLTKYPVKAIGGMERLSFTCRTSYQGSLTLSNLKKCLAQEEPYASKK
jgi:sulfite reductase alpha subunit-like flavoprotein